jgi:hypothetical protein
VPGVDERRKLRIPSCVVIYFLFDLFIAESRPVVAVAQIEPEVDQRIVRTVIDQAVGDLQVLVRDVVQDFEFTQVHYFYRKSVCVHI